VHAQAANRTRLAYPGVWRRRRDLGSQPVAEFGVDEQLTGFRLVVVRNQDPYLDRDDRALEDAHVAVCDLIRDVGPAEQTLDDGDYPGVVGPDELRHCEAPPVNAEWEATMVPTNCRTERAPLAVGETHVASGRIAADIR
jgi:hypothetical protein